MKLRQMHPWSCKEKRGFTFIFGPDVAARRRRRMQSFSQQIIRKQREEVCPRLHFLSVLVNQTQPQEKHKDSTALVARPHYFMFHSGIAFLEVWKLKRRDFVTDLTAEFQLFFPNMTLKKRRNQDRSDSAEYLHDETFNLYIWPSVDFLSL